MRKFCYLLSVAAMVCLLCGCGEKTVNEALARGEALARSGNWKEALKSAERAVSLEPENTSALLFYAIANEENGNADKALDSARHAATLTPDDFYAQYTLGRLYAKDPSRQTEAFMALSKAHKLNPRNTDALILLVNAAMKLKTDKALEYLLKLQGQPDFKADAVFSNELAVAYLRRKDFDTAKKKFLQACASKDPRIILNTAIFLDRYSGPRHGRQLYGYFLKHQKNNPEFEDECKRVEARLRQL